MIFGNICFLIYKYAVFVSKIKKYRDSMELKEAIDLTVRECIEENILRDFLKQHRRKVIMESCESPETESFRGRI